MRILLIITCILVVNHSFAQCPADAAELIAGGTFSGTCSVDIGNGINITNAVIFTTGTLTLDGAGSAGNVTVSSGTGSITIQSGGQLIVDDGSLTVSNGATFTSAGDVSVNNGIFITGETTSADFQSGSSTSIDGDFDILDSDVTIAGTFTDSQIDDDEILLRGTSVLTVNNGANISDFDDIEFRNNDGISSLIINGGVVSIVDDLDLRPSSTDGDFVEVNGGSLEVGGNIALPDSPSNNLLIINSGGSVDASTINGATPGDPDDLPEGVVLNGGSFEVAGTELPVELLSFSSSYDEEKHTVQLNWSTASEMNNEGFYIERSTNGTSEFEEVGFVQGHNNSEEILNYTFTDHRIFANHYYRLRQVDYDGAFEYSPTILAHVEDMKNFNFKLKLFPNPSSGTSISIEGDPSIELSASLYNAEGIELFSTSSAQIEIVEALINNSLEGATPGIYLLNYGNLSARKNIKIVRK